MHATKPLSSSPSSKTCGRRRISDQVSAVNSRLSSFAAEASAAKAGLHLLARACVPLIERCRLLAAQKRLLAQWQRSTTAGASFGVTETNEIPYSNEAAPPSAGLLVSGLRTLVAALGRESQRGEGHSGRRDSHEEEDKLRRQVPGSVGARGGSPGSGAVASGKSCCSQPQRPVASLRAVAIALVAARRLAKLAAYRAERRNSARATTGARTPLRDGAATDKAYSSPAAARGTGGSGGDPVRGQSACSTGRCPSTQSPPVRRKSPTSRLRSRDRDYDSGVIPVGPAGSGGVPLLDETDVSLLHGGLLVNGEAAAFLRSPFRARTAVSPGGDADAAAADGNTAAVRCLELLGVLVASGGGEEGRALPGGGFGIEGMAGRPTLLQLLAAGQVGHWRRLEERGLVPLRRGSCGAREGRGGGIGSESFEIGASRVIAGRHAR